VKLASGAEARLTNERAAQVVVCVNGGQGKEVPGTWSASLEWLVRRLASRRPELGFLEVRYRIKSWRVLDLCIEDCLAAIAATDAERITLLGFSMGGAVAIAAAGEPRVTHVLGLAPWIPDRLEVSPLRGRRLDVLHGSLDRWLPGVPGVSPALSRRGFVHAHVGWLFDNLGMEQGREYGKDLYENRLVRTIDRLYIVWVAVTLGLPFLIGYAVGGTLATGLEALVWGGLIRIFLYQHATFSVNSICHMFGRQDYRSRDQARNNWVVAVLVFGEGWHNNHHAFPASARHGLHRWQIDVSWWVIRGLEKLRLVWNVKVPDAEQLRRRRAQSAPA